MSQGELLASPLALELDPAQAWALAEMLKRVGYQDVRPLAVNGDEAHTMLAALDRVRAALALAGFSA